MSVANDQQDNDLHIYRVTAKGRHVCHIWAKSSRNAIKFAVRAVVTNAPRCELRAKRTTRSEMMDIESHGYLVTLVENRSPNR